MRTLSYCPVCLALHSSNLSFPTILLASTVDNAMKRWCKLFELDCCPDDLKLDISDILVDWVVPKFHIMAHGPTCQSNFSLNFLRYMARTDGENIERGWAWLNVVTSMVHEMGWGAFCDFLNDQWHFWNWVLFLGMGLVFPFTI